MLEELDVPYEVVHIDFKGGQSWLVTTNTLTVAEATSTAEAAGVTQPTVVQLTDQITHTRQIEVTADLNSLSVNERQAIEFKVTDALAAAAMLKGNGVPLVKDVHETAWGTREFVIKDDQGHTLYFGQRR